MRSPRRTLRLAVLRLLLAAVLYIAMMLGWLWWSDGYATAFRAAGNFVFAKWHDGAEVHFVAQEVSGMVGNPELDASVTKFGSLLAIALGFFAAAGIGLIWGDLAEDLDFKNRLRRILGKGKGKGR